LLGLPVNDVDLATRLRPEEVIERLEKVRVKAVPTGIDHGTITAVSDGHPIEVTTLRCDLSTDGRRATVAFTDDWEVDAARRDFTINALSADPRTGEIFDYFGGPDDRNHASAQHLAPRSPGNKPIARAESADRRRAQCLHLTRRAAAIVGLAAARRRDCRGYWGSPQVVEQSAQAARLRGRYGAVLLPRSACLPRRNRLRSRSIAARRQRRYRRGDRKLEEPAATDRRRRPDLPP